MRKHHLHLLLALILFTGQAAQAQDRPGKLDLTWSSIDSLQAGLPPEIKVFEGESKDPPLRAWYVAIQQPGSGIPVSIEMSGDLETRRETVSEFAERLDACVAVNGGYFTMNRTPAVSNGLLVTDEQVQSPATGMVARDSVQYPAARATLGITPHGRPEITWTTNRGDTVQTWDTPPDNVPGRPASINNRHADPWTVEDALEAGPMIVQNGQVHVTANEEVFFGTSIPERHPRTAAGITREGHLILMVVDGRQEASIGVTLEELAVLMLQAGSEEALNLDGGGSSALVVNGVLLNRPQGNTTERPVHNAVAAFCE